jgi:hypothetical protein
MDKKNEWARADNEWTKAIRRLASAEEVLRNRLAQQHSFDPPNTIIHIAKADTLYMLDALNEVQAVLIDKAKNKTVDEQIDELNRVENQREIYIQPIYADLLKAHAIIAALECENLGKLGANCIAYNARARELHNILAEYESVEPCQVCKAKREAGLL